MNVMRQCSRTACGRPAVATLTYVYADQTAVLGPLATYAEPHSYDLCADHTHSLTAPRGWDVVRLEIDFDDPTGAEGEMTAIADAVSGRRRRGTPAPTSEPPAADPGAGDRRGHLRLLGADDAPRREEGDGRS